PRWRGRAMAAGTALAVVTVAVAALAATNQLPGTEEAGTDAQARPSTTAPAPADNEVGRSTPPAPTPTPTPTPTPSQAATSAPPSPHPSPSAPAARFTVYRAPEGFSVALPKGWKRVETRRQGDLAFRVTFGAKGDDRTLAVTFSTRLGPDPVEVWRDTVEPELRKEKGFHRIGEIRATTYQGFKAADMEWVQDDGHGGVLRTFGRGFLTGEHSGFSLRWTTPEADWEKPVNVEALKTFFKTFRPN
ncbi:serine/threonine protein kinase, partial [Streptomyces sp. S6]